MGGAKREAEIQGCGYPVRLNLNLEPKPHVSQAAKKKGRGVSDHVSASPRESPKRRDDATIFRTLCTQIGMIGG